jgi:hypothetical protein
MNSVKISPPNSILFVLDPTNKSAAIPTYIDGKLVSSTESCVSVATLPDIDGETEISLESSRNLHSDLNEVFSGKVSTPGSKIAIVTSQLQKLLEMPVSQDKTMVRIWANDQKEPNKIVVGIG